jgi:dTDP-4-amino-4,6-dideoxygalactose transaminase
LCQLRKLPANNERRRRLTQVYREAIEELAPQVVAPFQDHPGTSAGHLMPVLLPAGADREHVMESMKAQVIQTSIHYPPVHTFSAYRGEGADLGLPLTEELGAREVTLPLYPAMQDEDVLVAVRAVAQALNAG